MSVPIVIFKGLLFYLVIRIIARIWRAPRELGEMAARVRAERSGKQITKGFIGNRLPFGFTLIHTK